MVAASEVASAFKLDGVLFVPTGEPWQKSKVTDGEHRYLMSVIATASNPRFTVSRVDIDRDGPTYTIDTLKDVQKAFPEAELFFKQKAAYKMRISDWRSVVCSSPLPPFTAVTRPGHLLELPDAPANAISVLEIPALAISSTDIRARVAAGEPVWYLVPDGVVQYIGKHNLYQVNQ